MKIILIGESGSGKDTISDYLKNTYNLKPLKSYTTRPKRTSDEDTHTFITLEEYKQIDDKDKIAETFFNNNYYCATINQLNESDIYIVDKQGLDMLHNNYKEPFKVFYIYVVENVRYKRLVNRDGEAKAKERIEHDKTAFKDINYDYIIMGELPTNIIGDSIYKAIRGDL